MANCIHCNIRLPFFKVGFLSKRKNLVECPKCNKKMLGDPKQLSNIGATVGGFGSVFITTGLLFFYNYSVILSLLIFAGIAVVFLGMIIQNKKIKLVSVD